MLELSIAYQKGVCYGISGTEGHGKERSGKGVGQVKNMTTGRAMPLIAGFAVPLLIGGVFQQVYNLVDVMIVGRYLGEQALAGVGSTGSLTFFMLSLVMGLCNGAGILVAQCFGVGNFADMRRAVTSIIWIAAILTAIVMLIGVFACPFFLRLLSVPEDVIGYSVTYMRILLFFTAGSVSYNGASAILRSLGDSKTPLTALIIASVINIALDLLLIVAIPLGVAGAAIATVIAQHVSAGYCILYLYRKREMFGLAGLPARPDRDMTSKIFRIGVPTAFQSCLISLGSMSVQRLINSFGASVMAGYTAAVKIDNIAIQVITSLGSALSVFTSQNIGNRQFKRIREGLHCTLAMSVAASLVIAAAAMLFGRQLMTLFLGSGQSQDAVSVGAQYLTVMGIAYLICAVMQSYQNIIRGSGDANTCMVAGLTELAGRIVFAYLLSPRLGAMGIWIATPLSWGCGCVVPVIRYYSGKWKNKALVQHSDGK